MIWIMIYYTFYFEYRIVMLCQSYSLDQYLKSFCSFVYKMELDRKKQLYIENEIRVIFKWIEF